nr:hypothetical protein GCM10020092_044960 [Actinoplanes digitatis]
MTHEGRDGYRGGAGGRRVVTMTALLERPPRTAPTIVFGPNWFASVMGTGILATAAAALPVHVPGLRILATLGWALAAALLAVLVVAAVRHARTYADDPVLSQFWGAPPMALMTVGAGTLLVGRDWLGEPVAVAVDLVLWTVGTVLGLAVAVAVPYRMMTRHRAGPDAAFGGWLMPVVSPMVSAAGGALLVPHVAARAELLLACYAMFGVSLFAAILVIGQIWGRADAARRRSRPAGADAVDRARPARPVGHRRTPARACRAGGAARAVRERRPACRGALRRTHAGFRPVLGGAG